MLFPLLDTVIRAGITYSFYAVPYSLPSITKLDKKIIGIQKPICGLPKCTANVITQLPHDLFRLEAFSLKNAYLRCINEQLRNALNDKGRLRIIYKGLIQHILSKHIDIWFILVEYRYGLVSVCEVLCLEFCFKNIRSCV